MTSRNVGSHITHRRPSAADVSALKREITDSSGLWGRVKVTQTDELEKSAGRVATSSEIESIVDGFHQSSSLPFEFLADGCQARAHLMCESLRQNGIHHSKIFLQGKLKGRSGLDTANWKYHVAPLVFVETDSGVESRVLDPALSKEPMEPEDWIRASGDRRLRHDKVTVKLTSPEQYTPKVSAPFEERIQGAVDMCENYREQQEENRERIDRIPLLKMRGVERDGPMDSGYYENPNGVITQLFPEGLPEVSADA